MNTQEKNLNTASSENDWKQSAFLNFSMANFDSEFKFQETKKYSRLKKKLSNYLMDSSTKSRICCCKLSSCSWRSELKLHLNILKNVWDISDSQWYIGVSKGYILSYHKTPCFQVKLTPDAYLRSYFDGNSNI